jgi:hypothetical protein
MSEQSEQRDGLAGAGLAEDDQPGGGSIPCGGDGREVPDLVVHLDVGTSLTAERQGDHDAGGDVTA